MKKVLYLLILIISLFIINNLVRSIFSLWQKHDLIGEAQKELQRAKNEHERLKNELDRVNRPDFVEKEARNKLFMVKPGEKTVVLGEMPDNKQKVVNVTSKTTPVWKQWWELFF